MKPSFATICGCGSYWGWGWTWGGGGGGGSGEWEREEEMTKSKSQRIGESDCQREGEKERREAQRKWEMREKMLFCGKVEEEEVGREGGSLWRYSEGKRELRVCAERERELVMCWEGESAMESVFLKIEEF